MQFSDVDKGFKQQITLSKDQGDSPIQLDFLKFQNISHLSVDFQEYLASHSLDFHRWEYWRRRCHECHEINTLWNSNCRF